MLKTLLLSPAGISILFLAVGALLPLAFSKVIGFFAARPRLAPLEPVLEAADDAVTAAAAAAKTDLLAGKATLVLVDAGTAALQAAKADLPKVEAAVSAEVNVLVNGTATKVVLTDGGATVTLPDLTKKS